MSSRLPMFLLPLKNSPRTICRGQTLYCPQYHHLRHLRRQLHHCYSSALQLHVPACWHFLAWTPIVRICRNALAIVAKIQIVLMASSAIVPIQSITLCLAAKRSPTKKSIIAWLVNSRKFAKTQRHRWTQNRNRHSCSHILIPHLTHRNQRHQRHQRWNQNLWSNIILIHDHSNTWHQTTYLPTVPGCRLTLQKVHLLIL